MCSKQGGPLGGLKVSESATRLGGPPGEDGSRVGCATGYLPGHPDL